jgi:hypothetical protein
MTYVGGWTKMDLREIEWDGVDWFDLVNTVMNHLVP